MTEEGSIKAHAVYVSVSLSVLYVRVENSIILTLTAGKKPVLVQANETRVFDSVRPNYVAPLVAFDNVRLSFFSVAGYDKFHTSHVLFMFFHSYYIFFTICCQ